MEDAYEKLFHAMHQFKKLNVSSIISGLSNSEFNAMGAILAMGENGQITTTELAVKTRTLPPAVSRTLRGLEEKGYVERKTDTKDRRNTYVSLTEKGWEKAGEIKETMHDFGTSVISQMSGEELELMVRNLNKIYEISEKEIAARKRQNREDKQGKGKENE